MKHWKVLPVVLMILFLAGSSQAEEKSSKETHAEKVKAMEDTFWAASKAGNTVKGVIVEGNSLFNGTTAPQDKPYTEEELLAAKISAERNSKLFILAEDGTLYYPTCKKGQSVSQSDQAHRIPRVLTEEQKKEGMFTWSNMVPLTGRKVELYGEIYPGYAGVKGIHIKSIYYEGEYIVGD
ncbi:MAG: hypothetical protein KAQ81_07405 [Deltaproteobacteria bacterium]|nr:hypothetical protein [Deltaproteobacteria bacterium]